MSERKLAEDALHASEAFRARTERVARVGGWELNPVDGTMKWSAEMRRIHDVSESFAPTLDLAISVYAPEGREVLTKAVRLALEEGKSFDLELPLVTTSGKHLWVRAVGEPERDGDGRVHRLVGACQDITERVTLEASLQRQTATLSSVIEAIPAMVAVMDSELQILLVNRAFELWREKAREDLTGRHAAEVLQQDEYEHGLPWAKRALAGETVSYERFYPRAAQHRYMNISYIPLRFDDASVHGIIAVAQDITSHRDTEKRLIGLAERDALTGVLNRVGLNTFLARACEEGEAASLALLYIDLDRFKQVNDSHGHAIGDELLQQFALRVQRLVRPTDAVARLGGDEFAVVLRNVRALADAHAVAGKVVEVAKSPFQIRNLSLRIEASVGVTLNAAGDEGWKGLVERADADLYAAKAANRGKRA